VSLTVLSALQVVMESEETELRDCDEAFESEEGDVEPYLEEPASSRELLERLRELEVRNTGERGQGWGTQDCGLYANLSFFDSSHLISSPAQLYWMRKPKVPSPWIFFFNWF
jgi:hypothetical protein